jgi:F-type H+-transporting ATPase subunit delta
MAHRTSAPEQKHSDHVDVGAQQVGAVYARALLGAAEKTDQLDAIVAELDSLVDDVLDAFPQFEAVISTAMIRPKEKIAVVERTLGGQASPLLLDFLRVLAEHGRLDVLRPIRQAAHRLYDELRGRVRVKVTTAAPLDEDTTGHIVNRLRGMLGEEPQLQQTVDPRVIGGLVLRVGDTIYDGSVATRLARIRDQMINRSVHEIQSRRDSFSYPAGN